MRKVAFNPLGQWTLEKSMDSNVKNALGITPEKGKLKFNPGFGQAEYKKYVKQRADHMKKDGNARGDENDFNWHYEPVFDLAKLTPIKGSAENWKKWYAGEQVEWVHDHGDARKGHFEKWSKHPEAKPVIIIEGVDNKGTIHVIDGHHRAAYAHVIDMKTIPVIYGRRKNK